VSDLRRGADSPRRPRLKLLIDQNLADKLVARLVTRYPGTGHVRESHAERDDDSVIWVRCRDEGYVLLTKAVTSKTSGHTRGRRPTGRRPTGRRPR